MISTVLHTENRCGVCQNSHFFNTALGILKVHIETLRTAGAVTVVPKIECVMTDTHSGHIDDVVNGRGVVA